MLMALCGVHGLSLKFYFPCDAREREQNSLKDIYKTSTDRLFYRRYGWGMEGGNSWANGKT